MKNNKNLNENQMDRFAEAATKHNIEKQLRLKYDKILQKKKKAERKKGIINISTLVKIAAMVVTVLGSIYLIQETYFSPSPHLMAQKYLDQTNISGNPDITRKGVLIAKTPPQVEDKIDDSLENQILLEANNAFIIKNYTLAIAKYEALEKEKNLLSIDRFYLGVSYLKKGSYTDAITHFQKVKSKEKFHFEEVDWLLSLAYVLSDQKEKAKPILGNIIAEKRYKMKEAKVLLSRLK